MHQPRNRQAISFDRAADYYDATRGYPPAVQAQVGQALLDAADATPESRILELGVGTGRIALPIIRAGYHYTGIDVAPRMLDKLRAALAEIPGAAERVTLVEGDITELPFADRSFDVVITVHVYHLIADRARAIAEGVRVLDRPGVALNGRDDEVDPPEREAAAAWREFVQELGWPMPSGEEHEAARRAGPEWARLGAIVDEVVAAERGDTRAPADFIRELESRQWSSTWAIPDEIFAAALPRLRAWAEQHYGERLETRVPFQRRFVIERGRFA